MSRKRSFPAAGIPFLHTFVVFIFLCGAPTAFAADLTISQNTTWSSGLYIYDNILVTNNATLTLQSNSTTGEGVTLNAVNLTVEPGAAISGSGQGYARDTGPGTGSYGPFGSGGSGHGGAGGNGRSGVGGVGYGSIITPNELGSGGKSYSYSAAGGAGGGLIKINVAEALTVNGSILAHGLSGICWGGSYYCAGGGAGGSIYVTAGTLSGSGLIGANGGNGGGTRGGGGAGGRIALYYTVSTFSGVVSASGGWGYQNGAAGTIFSKLSAQVNGDLLIDNGNGVGAVTTLPDGTYNFGTITIRNKAKADLSPGAVVTAVNLIVANGGIFSLNTGTLDVSDLTLSSSGEIITTADLNIDNVAFNSGTLVNNGNLTLTALTPAGGLNSMINNGRLTVPSLTIEGFTLYQRGTLNIADNTMTVGVNGILASDVSLGIGNIVVKSGGVLTHSVNGSVQQYAIDINAVDLTIEPGGRIDVNGKGYGGQVWDNYTGPGGASNGDIWNHPGGGAGHGGEGGDSTVLSFPGGGSYGTALNPVDLGSGGGKANGPGGYYATAKGGDGGGSVKLAVSNILTVDGIISADGGSGGVVDRYGSGGGSGGSIHITANTVAGSGNITANGGNGGDAVYNSHFPDKDGGGGAGGRIALYCAANALTGRVNAYGGWGYQNGAAGTVFSKSGEQVYGDLTIDNNNSLGASTPLAVATYDFDTIAVRNKARVDLSADSVVAAHDFVAENGAIFNNPGTINSFHVSISSTSQITNSRDLNAENITFDSGTILNNGSLAWVNSEFLFGTSSLTNYGHVDIPHLSIMHLSFIQRGILAIADNQIVIDSEGKFFSDVPLQIGSMVINSGGILTHSQNTHQAEGYRIDITASNFIVNSGGKVDVDQKGFEGHYYRWDDYNGPGGGGSGMSYYNAAGAGAGYGGQGGGSFDASGGRFYGITSAPIYLGSGGGRAKGNTSGTEVPGGSGGGAVKLIITDTITHDGSISANGGHGRDTGFGEYGSGGGSGGSIFIVAENLNGSGSISANGGDGGNATHAGGGGAGGRIAVFHRQDSLFSGIPQVNGGFSASHGGENGTVLFIQKGIDIAPDKGGNTGSVSVVIFGGAFANGVNVKLVKSGEVDILGRDLKLENNGMNISVTFDLAGTMPGQWDVVVTNPVGGSIVLPYGFTIEKGLAPELWVDVLGRSTIIPRREQKYWVVYGNRGNVDIPEANVFLSTSGEVLHRLEGDDQFVSNARQITSFNLRPGESRFFPVRMKMDIGGMFSISLFGASHPENFEQLRSRVYPPDLVESQNNQFVSASMGASTSSESITSLNYDLTYPPVIKDPTQSIPAGYIIDGDVCSVVVVCSRQQGISIGNGKIRWSYADVGGTEEISLLDVLNNTDGLHGKFRFKYALRPDPNWGRDGNGNVVSPDDLASFVRSTTEFLIKDKDTQNLRQIPFPTSERIKAFIEQAYNEGDPEKMEIALGMKDELRAISNYPQTDFISCFDAASFALNKTIALYGDHFGVDIMQFTVGVYDNATFASALAKRNGITEVFTVYAQNALFLPNLIELIIRTVQSYDPNDKIGPQGVGPQRFVSGEEPLRYAIFFENLETATAPAQEVTITDQLDPVNLDLNTFSFGPIVFGEHVITPPPGSKEFFTEVDLRPATELKVHVKAHLDMETGMITWMFTSLDPNTNNLPEDPLVGFLPPNIMPPEGDGSVVYTVEPVKTIPTGTEIRNKATIIFDYNDPINTPEWVNTIDNTAPESTVLPLISIQNINVFLVQWSGADEGAGIRDFTIYVNEDGGPFRIWEKNVATMSGLFLGEEGKDYGFYSVARDWSGNVEVEPDLEDALTRVVLNTPPQAVDDSYNVNEDEMLSVLVSGILHNDSDAENDSLSTVIVDNVTQGVLTLNADGSFDYLPSLNFYGTDSFTYMANDGELNSELATVVITVNSVNDAPIANAGLDQQVFCGDPSGTPVTFDGLASWDAENDSLSYAWTGAFPEGNGIVTGVNPTVSMPIGTSTVSLIVNDGLLDSTADTVNITITIGVDGFLSPLTTLVPKGQEVVLPDKAFKQGRTLPLKLQLLCGTTVLTEAEVAPPQIVSIVREGEAVNLETIDPDAGEANDGGMMFRFSDVDSQWVYNLDTGGLSAGTYSITIKMPDGKQYVGGFVLR